MGALRAIGQETDGAGNTIFVTNCECAEWEFTACESACPSASKHDCQITQCAERPARHPVMSDRKNIGGEKITPARCRTSSSRILRAPQCRSSFFSRTISCSNWKGNWLA